LLLPVSWNAQYLTSSSATTHLNKGTKKMGMLTEFKEFAMKGSLMDMAAGIIIGAATTKVVSALVDNILMPLIGTILGGIDFSALAIKIGDASIGYGAFIQALIDFTIIAFVIFMILKGINSLRKAQDEAPAPPPADVALLAEIRDLLKNR
jgi:large conductance mechanosensitive channel